MPQHAKFDVEWDDRKQLTTKSELHHLLPGRTECVQLFAVVSHPVALEELGGPMQNCHDQWCRPRDYADPDTSGD